MKIIEVLMVLWWFYLNSMLPSLSENYAQKNYAQLWNMLWISLKILLSFALLIFALGNLFWTEVISIIATPEYLHPIWSLYSSLDAFRIVLWVLVFYFLSLSFIYMLIASERQWILLWVNIIVTAINIIWNIILIPYFSFYGAAMVTLWSQILLMIITGSIVLKDLRFPRKYLISMWLSMLWISLIYFIFVELKTFVLLDNIASILFFTPLFLVTYFWLEFLCSKKLFIK